jgi:S-adenosylmethionine hydrolase
MPEPIITLTTDFGEASPYVAALKGVILGAAPRARIVDLSHQIPPQDVRHAAFFLAVAVPHFPPDVLHVVVVDPGVGTERAILFVELEDHKLLVPDNGCWSDLARLSKIRRVIQVAEEKYWRPPVCSTFHGRDIFAPVAAHLGKGIAPEKLGPPAQSWVSLEPAMLEKSRDSVAGEVIFIDHFGNLITNIPESMVAALPGKEREVTLAKKQLRCRFVTTYGDAKPGTLLGLISSAGTFEIARAQGNARARLKAAVGMSVVVRGHE